MTRMHWTLISVDSDLNDSDFNDSDLNDGIMLHKLKAISGLLFIITNINVSYSYVNISIYMQLQFLYFCIFNYSGTINKITISDLKKLNFYT